MSRAHATRCASRAARRIASVCALRTKSGGNASSGRGRPRRCTGAACCFMPPQPTRPARRRRRLLPPHHRRPPACRAARTPSPQSTHTPRVGSSSYGSISVCKHTSPSSSAVGTAFCAPSGSSTISYPEQRVVLALGPDAAAVPTDVVGLLDGRKQLERAFRREMRADRAVSWNQCPSRPP